MTQQIQYNEEDEINQTDVNMQIMNGHGNVSNLSGEDSPPEPSEIPKPMLTNMDSQIEDSFFEKAEKQSKMRNDDLPENLKQQLHYMID